MDLSRRGRFPFWTPHRLMTCKKLTAIGTADWHWPQLLVFTATARCDLTVPYSLGRRKVRTISARNSVGHCLRFWRLPSTCLRLMLGTWCH